MGNKRNLEGKVISLQKQVSVFIQGTLDKKEKAIGPFVLLVTLGKHNSKGALVDPGASISLMPMSIAKQLAFELKPSRKTNHLADQSVKLPCGGV